MSKTINGVEYTPFEPNKNATELGIDKSRKFDVFGELVSTIMAAGTNDVIRGKGFYISYIKAGSGPTGDETALVYKGKFYILNGDWQEEYKKLIPKGYKACKKLFDDNKKEYLNNWSD